MIVPETTSLTRRFGALTAVDGLTLSVESGEVYGLLGPDGAGKTTVIKMFTTLLPNSWERSRRRLRHHASEVRRVIV